MGIRALIKIVIYIITSFQDNYRGCYIIVNVSAGKTTKLLYSLPCNQLFIILLWLIYCTF